MTDLAKTIAPKSDQLNADDMIAGPMTITITGVRGSDDPDQPVAVSFEGDNKKPYKPCKSMRRVMVHAWGPDGSSYAGRRLTLFCDPNVQFGGIKVGGIRISHMSHIDREMVVPLTVTRAKRSPYTVKPLAAEVHRTQTSELTLGQRADAYAARIAEAPSTVKLTAIKAAAAKLYADLEEADPARKAELETAWQARHDELTEGGQE